MLTLLACLPLTAVWYNNSLFRSIDQWWNIRTIGGFFVYAGLVPALLLLFVWIVLLIMGWSMALVLASSLTITALVLIWLKLIRDRRRKTELFPYDDADPQIFHTFQATEGTLEILHAEVPISHTLDVKMWFPKHVNCAGCGINYVVYVPAQASQPRSILSKLDGSDVPVEMLKQLAIQAVKSVPNLVNGCIRCGRLLDGATSNCSVKRSEPFKVNTKFVLITVMTTSLAVAVIAFSGPIGHFSEELPLVGGLLGYVFEELSGLVVFFLSLPAAFLIWHLVTGLADRSTKRGSGPYRMTACPKEGLIFEDIAAERDPICPSCRGQLEPLRRFSVVAS